MVVKLYMEHSSIFIKYMFFHFYEYFLKVDFQT